MFSWGLVLEYLVFIHTLYMGSGVVVLKNRSFVSSTFFFFTRVGLYTLTFCLFDFARDILAQNSNNFCLYIDYTLSDNV